MMRRAVIFFFTLFYATVTVPKKMWISVADHREGVGFFSDPIAKPSLFFYWRNLSESVYCSMFLRYKRPTEEGLAASSNSPSPVWDADGVTVIDGGSFMEFKPPEGVAAVAEADSRARIGVIVLPGSLVSPPAYAPLARMLARNGHPSFVLKFNFNLATFGWERIGDIIEHSKPEGDNCPVSPTKWVLVGHSMGTMAVERFYTKSPESVDGVVYIGSGDALGDTLSGVEDLPSLIIRASRDPYCPKETLEQSVPKMPTGLETVVVEGGNHRGFASYSWQPLDWKATISEQEQRRIVVETILDFIERRVTV